jgi:Bacterial SH3 domain
MKSSFSVTRWLSVPGTFSSAFSGVCLSGALFSGALLLGPMAGEPALAIPNRDRTPLSAPSVVDLAADQYQAQAASVVYCEVVNLQQGQLAVRFSPGGDARAGLDNGNLVRYIESTGIWYLIEVVNGPNRRVNGVQGWVNSNYLDCAWD